MARRKGDPLTPWTTGKGSPGKGPGPVVGSPITGRGKPAYGQTGSAGFTGNSSPHVTRQRRERNTRRQYHQNRQEAANSARRPWTPFVPEGRKNYAGTIDARPDHIKKKKPLEQVKKDKPSWSPFSRRQVWDPKI